MEITPSLGVGRILKEPSDLQIQRLLAGWEANPGLFTLLYCIGEGLGMRQESVALIRHLSQGCCSTTRELIRCICRGRTSQSDLTL